MSMASAAGCEGKLRHTDCPAGKSTLDSAQLQAMLDALKNRGVQKPGHKPPTVSKSAKMSGKRV